MTELSNRRGDVLRAALTLCLLAPLTCLQAQTAEKADASDAELSEVVVTAVIGSYHEGMSTMASKLPMEMRDLASSLSILNSTAISDRNANSLVDVVNYVVGATQSQNNINGFSFRGFTNTGSYTQNIQFDGLMGATLKKAATTAANVERIEFLKGPNGVLYGQMNPGGLLNIVTKDPLSERRTNLRTALGVHAGAFSDGPRTTTDFSIDNTGPVFNSSRLLYRVVADYTKAPSSRPDNTDTAFSIYPSLSFRWSDDTVLSLKGEDSQDRRRQDEGVIPIFNGTPITVRISGSPNSAGVSTATASTAAYGPDATWYTAPLNTVYNDPSDWARDYGSAFAFAFQTRLGDWHVRAQGRSVWHVDEVVNWSINNANIYSTPVTAAATSASPYAIPTSLLRRQYNHVKNGHRYNFADFNAYHVFGPESFQNTVLLGVGGGGEAFLNNRIAFGPNAPAAQNITLQQPALGRFPYPAEGTGARNQATWQTSLGQYISDQIKIGDRFNISIGVRHDDQRFHSQDLLNPALTSAGNVSAYTKQAGVVWHVVPAVSAYASYSTSIKPAVVVAYDNTGNSDFPPETGEQYEAGVKFETADKNLNLTLAAYEINRSNVLVPTGQTFTVPTGSAGVGSAISRLDGKQQSKGYEVELQWQPKPNWQVQTGWAHSSAIIAESATNPFTVGMNLVNAPTNSGNLWTRYNIPNGPAAGLGFGMGVIYVGDAWAGDPTTRLYYVLPAYTRVDLSAYYKIGTRYDFAVNIQNATDKRYISSSQSAFTLNVGEQRKVTLSVGAHF